MKKYISIIIIIFLLFLTCVKTENEPTKISGITYNQPEDYTELEIDTKIYVKKENQILNNNELISFQSVNSNQIVIENKRSNSVNFIVKIFDKDDNFVSSSSNNIYIFSIDGINDLTDKTFSINSNSSKNITISKKGSPNINYKIKIEANYHNFGVVQYTLSNNPPQNDDFGGYYANIDFNKTGNELRQALYNLVNSTFTKRLTYSECWDGIKFTDEDPENPNNVILIYTRWSIPKSKAGTDPDGWNREHTWPQSRGNLRTDTTGPGTDLHHLRACDVTVNSSRGNNEFDNGGTIYYDSSPYQGYSTNTGCKKTSTTWDPIDSMKGDVARMMFYMDLVYDNKGGKDFVDLVLNESTNNPTTNSSPAYLGKLATLKQWHQQDPPDDFEKRRNQRIYQLQGNRNPFIDKPELVQKIWGN